MSLDPDFIYLDYCATTPVDPKVIESMLPYFTQNFGNASSRNHAMGWFAEDAVNTARKEVAGLLNCASDEVFFTSGATESINLALRGLFNSLYPEKKHIITVCTEHKAVLETCLALKSMGAELTILPVDEAGKIDLNELKQAITPHTALVAIMSANNETGVLHPIESISKICQETGVPLFSDAVQWIGKTPMDLRGIPVDLLAFSAHKMYGPKGVGGLFIRKSLQSKISPILTGGGQERGLRNGTLNVPGIVGLGKAAFLAQTSMQEESQRLKGLRNKLEAQLLEIPGTYINGGAAHRLPHVSNLSFLEVNCEDLLFAFNHKLALSTGSACNSAKVLPSHVLLGMGRSETEAFSSLRISMGRFTTEIEIERMIEILKQSIHNHQVMRKGLK